MRLFEFADAEAQIALWKLISDSVWAAMSQEREQQARAAAKKPKSSPRSKNAKRVTVPSPPKPPKPKTEKTQSKKLPVKISAATRQAANQQQLPQSFNNTARSNAVTTNPMTSSAATDSPKNAANAQSVAQTQRQLYPLANDETVKRLTR